MSICRIIPVTKRVEIITDLHGYDVIFCANMSVENNEVYEHYDIYDHITADHINTGVMFHSLQEVINWIMKVNSLKIE